MSKKEREGEREREKDSRFQKVKLTTILFPRSRESEHTHFMLAIGPQNSIQNWSVPVSPSLSFSLSHFFSFLEKVQTRFLPLQTDFLSHLLSFSFLALLFILYFVSRSLALALVIHRDEFYFVCFDCITHLVTHSLHCVSLSLSPRLVFFSLKLFSFW